jgi:predicted Fe-S protein YdhL (DUF1289 family)
MTRTVEQERADIIAYLNGIVRGCDRHANERPDKAAMHENTKRVMLTAIEDIKGGIHEGEAG